MKRTAKTFDQCMEALSKTFSDGARKRYMSLVSHIPCTGPGPADPEARRKWAIDGLHKLYKWFPFQNEDRSWVRHLAPYQEEVWADRWERVGDNTARELPRVRFVIKSQKIGMSRLHILENIHIALSPRAWGREIIIAAQNQVKAEEHLKDLKDLIRRSPFRELLIEQAPRTRTGRLMRESLSRSNVAALINPAAPDSRPTRIWAVGITSHGLLLSNTSVEHIHLSDVTVAEATPIELDRSLAQVRSRIVKSRGTMVVETPAGGPTGYVFRQYREACRALAAVHGTPFTKLPELEAADTEWGRFRRLPYGVAVKAGVLEQDTIDRDRHEINNEYEFMRLYGADFLAGAMVAYPNAVRRRDAEAGRLLLENMLRVPGGQ